MRNTILIISLLASAFLIPVATAVAADAITIYSGRSDKFVKPAAAKFTEKTGIRVVLHSAKSTALLAKLKLEGNKTDADLYLSNDAGNLQKGADLGLFQVMPEDLISSIPANYRAKDNTWVGLSARARVLVVNTASPWSKKINSVFDLAKPELKNQIAITHSGNESFIAGATVYMLKAGEKDTKNWLAGLKDNSNGQYFNKHSKVVKAVATGKANVGLVNHYYIYRYLKKKPDAKIKLVLPDQGKDGLGVAWNVAGIAISKYSKNAENSLEFIRFLVSTEGQRLFAEVNLEYPTRDKVDTAMEIPKPGSFHVADIPMSELGRQRDKTIDLIEAIGLP